MNTKNGGNNPALQTKTIYPDRIVPHALQLSHHTCFMRKLLKEAELALQTGEYAIGAMIMHNGIIVGHL